MGKSGLHHRESSRSPWLKVHDRNCTEDAFTRIGQRGASVYLSWRNDAERNRLWLGGLPFCWGREPKPALDCLPKVKQRSTESGLRWCLIGLLKRGGRFEGQDRGTSFCSEEAWNPEVLWGFREVLRSARGFEIYRRVLRSGDLFEICRRV